MSDNIAEDVIKVVCEQLGHSREKVSESSRFVEDLGADSLDTVELVMAFEDKFDLSIPDTESDKIRSVEDAIRYIAEKKGAQKAGSDA